MSGVVTFLMKALTSKGGDECALVRNWFEAGGND
jgi:hypothetical protein